MASMNGGTLIIALPDLMRSLKADLFSAVWILIVYMLVQTILVLTAGRLADMFGRKFMYVVGFALFGITSIAAGFCTEAWQLVVIRGLQGAAGAFMIANASAIVTDAFPKTQLGLALGTNMIVFSVGSIIGTILGGWLTTLGWQWVFWFNVPFALLGTLWAVINLKELSQLDHSREHDVPGILVYMLAMTGLLVALTAGGIEGWSTPLVLPGILLALLGFPLFAWIESRSSAPMIDVTLFKRPPFSLGNLAVFLNSIARSGVTILFVFYYQGLKGLDALTAGLFLVPIAASMLVASPFSGLLADRYGSRLLSIIGLALNTAGLVMMALLDVNTTFPFILTAMIIMGFGGGLFNSPNTRMIMTSVPPHRRGIAAGTRSMLANSGGVVSIALVLALVSSHIDSKDLFSIFAGISTGLPDKALAQFISGFQFSFWVLAGFSAASLLVALLPRQEEIDEEGHLVVHQK